ncbi:hypothetical protein ATN83_2644 [Raoultella ornithinolytica]|nr:hypothetical protein ATN83_2644 [Raoultella ornithinolytica]
MSGAKAGAAAELPGKMVHQREIPRGGQQRKKHNQVNGGLDAFFHF